MDPITVTTALAGASGKVAGTVSSVVERMRAGASIKSLIDVSKPLRVEPITLLDNRLRHCEALIDIQKTILSIFSAYYLQAFALTANVTRVETRRVLEQLDPNRSGDLRIAHSFESADSLPSLPGEQKVISTEARDENNIYEVESLGIGKLLSLEINETRSADGDGRPGAAERVKVPVMVTLRPAVLDPEVFVHILGRLARNNSFKERFFLWRNGAKRTVDLLFNLDLIDEHRRVLAKDTSGTYRRIIENRKKHALAGLFSGKASLSSASNIAIISKETESEINRTVGGKLASGTIRNRIFEESMMMLLVVVDDEFDRITIYQRGIATPTIMSYRELRTAERGKGPDIGEILSTFIKASTPAL